MFSLNFYPKVCYFTDQNFRDIDHVELVGRDVVGVALLVHVHGQGQAQLRLVNLNRTSISIITSFEYYYVCSTRTSPLLESLLRTIDQFH